jgi:SAM-dependent methyltransferase
MRGRASQYVVDHHCRDGGDQAKCRCQQGFGDAGCDHREIGGVRFGNADEAVHDAPHRAEQPDEGSRRPDRSEVVATDFCEEFIQVARDRVSLYGLTADFHVCNATDLIERFEPASFDAVALFAVCEHMTLPERLKVIADCWELLKPGGHMIVVETPNRLWAYDSHTAMDNFFLWLPDELALRWVARSKKERFKKKFPDTLPKADATLLLARWGRGVSYHDFCVALRYTPTTLPVESCLQLFYRDARNEHRIYARTWSRRYEEIIHALAPEIHRGFFLEYLDLSLRKPGPR